MAPLILGRAPTRRPLRAACSPGAHLLALALVACTTGCATDPDANSGGDDKRETAKEMPLSMPVHDRLAPAEQDTTDWKSFTVPVYETTLTLSAWWDNPSVSATITMRDMFGGQLYKLDHQVGERKESWGGIRVRQGTYYLQIEGHRGDTVYTLEVVLGEGGPEPLPRAIPRPE